MLLNPLNVNDTKLCRNTGPNSERLNGNDLFTICLLFTVGLRKILMMIYSGENILNSKNSFNRCGVPRLSVMVGDRMVGTAGDSGPTDREVERLMSDQRNFNKKNKSEEQDMDRMAGQPPPKRKRYCEGEGEQKGRSYSERRGRKRLERKDQPSILSFLSKKTQRGFSENIESLAEAKVKGGSKKNRGDKRKLKGENHIKNFHSKLSRDEPEPKRNQGS